MQQRPKCVQFGAKMVDAAVPCCGRYTCSAHSKRGSMCMRPVLQLFGVIGRRLHRHLLFV
jgi:hypothetical protein